MSNDAKLKQAVLDELTWEPSVNAAHIGVTAANGVVTLMGHVETYGEKIAAERATSRVKGVKAIAEKMEVQLPVHTKRSDEEIAAAIVNRLAWDSTTPKDAIKVKVENGWVTLSGQVDWHYQKDMAGNEVRGLMGVTGLSNLTAIKVRPNTGDISESIRLAMHRSWYDDDNVRVSADGGKVKLSGTVTNWGDREMAASTAWASPGTTAVENNIAVD
jgi:osmotically-inducible protein OsmY